MRSKWTSYPKRASGQQLRETAQAQRHLSNSMLKKLVNSNVVKGMEVMNTHPQRYLWRLHHREDGWKTIQKSDRTRLMIIWNLACRPNRTDDSWSMMDTHQVQSDNTQRLFKLQFCVQPNSQGSNREDYHGSVKINRKQIPEAGTHHKDQQWQRVFQP